jgi:predicted transcriptional regulator
LTSANERLLFLSLKPRYADLILDGTKTVELRRRPPLIATPTEALVYSSTPLRALVGSCRVDRIVAMAPWTLWRKHGADTGVSRREFLRYFDGCSVAYGLLLSRPSRFDDSVDLAAMRQALGTFQPPQSFRYVPVSFHADVAAG